MSDDNEIDVKIKANPEEAEKGMHGAAEAVREGVEQMKGHFEGLVGMVEKVQGQLKAFAAILAGGEMFKESIEATLEYGEQIETLSKRLGITTEAASKLHAGMQLAGVSADEYVGAVTHLDRALRTSEASLNAMGLATRDSEGHFRNQQDILSDGLAVLNQYKEGTDRNMASQMLFGRNADVVTKLLRMNSETMSEGAKLAEQYGMVLGEDNVESMVQYKKSMEAMQITLEAVERAVGNAVLPIFKDLGNWFESDGPAVVGMFIKVIEEFGGVLRTVASIVGDLWDVCKEVFNELGALVQHFALDGTSNMDIFENVLALVEVAAIGLKEGFMIAFEVIGGAIEVVIAKIKMWGDIAKAAFSLDWDGIKSAYADGTKAVEQIISDSQDRIAKKTAENAAAMQAALMQSAERPGAHAEGEGEGKGKSFVDPAKAAEARKKAEEEAAKAKQKAFEQTMAQFKAEEEAAKGNYDHQLALARDLSDEISAAYGKDSKEYFAVQAEIIRIKRAATQQQRQLTDEELKQQEAGYLDDLKAWMATQQYKYNTGVITYDQLIAAQRTFEQQSFDIKKQALESQRSLVDPTTDPVQYKKLTGEIEQQARTHEAAMTAIARKQSQDMDKVLLTPFRDVMSGMQQGMDQHFKSMLKGTESFKQGMAGIWHSLGDSIVNMLADVGSKMIEHLALEALMGKTQVAQQAAAGAAKAYNATVGIPIVGPVLAPVAAAGAFAAISAFGSQIPSASGGFDIPAGINPLTQLHQSEMVLPAKYADVIRGMAGDGSGGGDTHHWHIHAADGDSVRRLFMGNQQHLVDALSRARRGGKFPSV